MPTSFERAKLTQSGLVATATEEELGERRQVQSKSYYPSEMLMISFVYSAAAFANASTTTMFCSNSGGR
jgi:hypothetical protein